MSAGEVVFSIANYSEWTNVPLMEVESSIYRGRIVPPLLYRVSGLNANSLYYAQIRLSRFDNQKYQFDHEDRVWRPRNNNNPPWEPQTLEYPAKTDYGSRIVKTGKDWMREGIDFTNTFIGTKHVPNTFVVKNGFVYVPTLVFTLVGGPSWEFSDDCQKFVPVSVYSSLTVATKRRGGPPENKPTVKRRRRGKSHVDITAEESWTQGTCVDPFAKRLEDLIKETIDGETSEEQNNPEQLFGEPSSPADPNISESMCGMAEQLLSAQNLQSIALNPETIMMSFLRAMSQMNGNANVTDGIRQ